MNNYDKVSTYFKENKKILVLLTISGLCFDGFMCLLPIIQGKFLILISSNNSKKIVQTGLLFLALVVFLQVNRFLKRYFVRYFANNLVLKMRQICFDNLLNSEMTYFDNTTLGEILTRNTDDILASSEGIRKMTTEVFDTFILMGGYFITMMFLDYKIALVSMPFIILAIISADIIKKRVYKANKDYKNYLDIHKAKTINLVANNLKYRGYGEEAAYCNDYKMSLGLLKNKASKALIYESSLEPIYLMVAYLGLILIAYLSGLKVINNIYKIDTFYTLILTYFSLAKKASKVGKLFNAYQGFKVSFVRIKPLLVNKTEQKITMTNFNALKLTNFSYSYPNGFKLPIINLEAKLGMIIGVSGAVHSGKSTFLKALSGLYPYLGEAYLGENSLANYRYSLQNIISYLSNKNSLFNDTFENNITLLREGGDLEKAIDLAMLKEEFKDNKQLLNFNNQNISGGQAKRLLLARGIYSSEVKVLLLDDLFLSIDKEMALQIFNNLKSQNLIVFMVSNQDYLLSLTDKILFFEKDKALFKEYNELLTQQNFKEMMVSSNGR